MTHNEALRMLDALVQLGVLDRDRAEPPAEPAEGDRHIVGADAAGAWEGRDGQVAAWQDGSWAFHAPREGWLAWVANEEQLLCRVGTDWTSPAGIGSVLQNLSLIGLGITADLENPFAAKLNKVLWTARYGGEGGDGNLRYTLNKEAPGKVLSLLMQSDWSGRAEIGLVGDDDLRLRVSGDGATWRDGLVIASATGKVSFPQGAAGLRERLAAPRTYYVRPDGDDSNDGLGDDAGGAFATIQRAVDVVFGALDLDVFDVTIQLADGTYAAGVVVTAPTVGAGSVTIQGNATNPENVLLSYTGSVAGHAAILVRQSGIVRVKDLELRTTGVSGVHGLFARGGYIEFTNVIFGPCTGAHIRADTNGVVEAVLGGQYVIAGSAQKHYDVALGGFLRAQQITVTLTGTPAFSSAFATGIISGSMGINNNTYNGAAAGVRYSLASNAVINTNGAGANYLPGDAAGTTASGGQYV